jgi:hypothetical protein
VTRVEGMNLAVRRKSSRYYPAAVATQNETSDPAAERRRAEPEAHATVLMAALEGAIILARARRNIEPLDTVERYFASRAPDPRRA